MDFLNFWRSKPALTAGATNLSSMAVSTAQLSPNQQKIAGALRRYEASLAPRLRQRTRPAPVAAEPQGEAERPASQKLKAYLKKRFHDAHRVQARFVVKLPEQLLAEMKEVKATAVQLKRSGEKTLHLELLRPEGVDAKALQVAKTIDVELVARGARREGELKQPVELVVEQGKYRLILPRQDAPVRVTNPRSANQGEAQNRLRERKRERARKKAQEQRESHGKFAKYGGQGGPARERR